jgi:hypothetical protein
MFNNRFSKKRRYHVGDHQQIGPRGFLPKQDNRLFYIDFQDLARPLQ